MSGRGQANDRATSQLEAVSPGAALDSRGIGGGRMRRRAWFWCAGALLLPVPAVAESRSRKIIRYDREVSGGALRAGAARGGVAASAEQVKRVVTDYASYARFIKQFDRARIVGRSGAATDLYLEIPILHGLSKIWAVVRFQPPQKGAELTLVRGRMIKGNVKRLDVEWRIQPLDSGWTELTAELVLDLKLPVPRQSVLAVVKRAAAQAVRGAREEAEQRAVAHS